MPAESDSSATVPPGLGEDDEIRWRYQRYIKDYLRTIAAIDDGVGRTLDWLDDNGLAENTIVVYTSDQGFFLGDHGWFDKRMMYEESLVMPFLIRYPAMIEPATSTAEIALNVDFAPTFLDLAGCDVPDAMQGTSFVPLLRGETPDGWHQSMYYRYWMHGDAIHRVPAHYGVRTRTHKLIAYYNDALDQDGALETGEAPEWELYDLATDPAEMHNMLGDQAANEVARRLRTELARLQRRVGDSPHPAAERALTERLATN